MRGIQPATAGIEQIRFGKGSMLRSAGRMRVCQIRIGRFCPGAGMLYH